MARNHWGIHEVFTDDFDDCPRLFPICCSRYQSGFGSNIHESYTESAQQEKDRNKQLVEDNKKLVEDNKKLIEANEKLIEDLRKAEEKLI